MSSFNDFALAPELNKALESLKFVKPTEVQAKTIPIASEGKDLMACAETGSGKTGAYAIPMISQLLVDTEMKGVILAPTRELARQIADFVRELIRHTNDIRVVTLVGGQDMRKQIDAIKRKPRIIVATPGRLTDHLRRRSLSLKTAGFLVLDEGDRMLDMGFAPQLDDILEFLPKERQTSLFTATLPDKVQKLAQKYLRKPVRVQIGSTSLPVEAIKQSVIEVEIKDKEDRLVDELNERKGSVIIFCKTQRKTDNVTRSLRGYGFNVDLIHGGRTQGQRNQAIKSFKSGKSRILCATDIAARGLDVPQVEHVINFDLPMMDEDYVHRIGRTARNGAEGAAVSFVTPLDHRTWEILVRKYKIKGADLTVTSSGKSRNKKSFGGRGRSNGGDRRESWGDDRRSNDRGDRRSGGGFRGRNDRRSEDGERRFSRDRNDSRRDDSRGGDDRRSGGFRGRNDDRRSNDRRSEGGERRFSRDRNDSRGGDDRRGGKRSFFGGRAKPEGRSENRWSDGDDRRDNGDRRSSGRPSSRGGFKGRGSRDNDRFGDDRRSEGGEGRRGGGFKKSSGKRKPFLSKGKSKRSFGDRDESSDSRPPRRGKKKSFSSGGPKRSGGRPGAKSAGPKRRSGKSNANSSASW